MAFLSNLRETMDKKEPEIFGTMGIVGGVLAVGFAIGGTILAYKAIEKKKEEKKADILKAKTEAAQSSDDNAENTTDVKVTVTEEETKLTKVETIKTVWKYYIPTVVIGGVAIYCSVRSTHAYASKLAAVTAAYKLSEKSRTEYMNTVKELLGERETQKVNNEAAQKRVNDNPPDENCIQNTGCGSNLCREELTGRYFYSSKQAIADAINKLNYEAMTSMWISVNDFFDKCCIDEVQLGDELGWSVEKGLIEPIFSTAESPNGIPVTVVDFMVMPSPRPKHLI